MTSEADGEVWLWRITDGYHHTSTTVHIREVAHQLQEEETADFQRVLETRGRSAVEESLGWFEPPRQITLSTGSGEPEYWGGRQDP
jgi:hypothetical protein